MPPAVLAAATHTARAERHARVGDALADAGDEWAGVCYFYSAYHHVRAALLEDPTFDTLSSCQARHPDLQPDDRSTGRHNGRRNTSIGREWGVNDLVRVLYQGASGTYERLHQISIDVRYGGGSRATIEQIQEVWSKFEGLRQQGVLTSGALGP